MSAIDTVFEELRAEGRTALVPFITAGDPDLDFTAELLHALSESGASVCEVGIPYSDPVADGPVIQASYSRALDQGIRVGDILQTLGCVAEEDAAPLVTMVIRDVSGSWVMLTERLSILNPRRLKRPATRANTPGRFSTKTEMECRMGTSPRRPQSSS